MSNAAKKKKVEPEVDVHDPSTLQGKLKVIGGSLSDDWNNIVANQLVSALWLTNCDFEEVKKRRHAAVDALICIGPRDDLEGMIAVQMIACHNASMECYRRAMIGEQTFEGRRDNLAQANKLSRGTESASRQRPAKSHGRARSRPQGRASDCWQRLHPGGRGRFENGGTTPCTWIFAGRHDAEHERGAGRSANHLQ